MSVTAPQAQPEPGQDPQDPTTQQTTGVAPPPAAPAAPAPVGAGPWANDLNAIFTDAGTRGQVDEFLRSKVQPYTTQLEQKAAQATDAVKLWSDFQETPIDTWVAVTSELLGQEVGDDVFNLVQQKLAAQQQDPNAQQAPQQAGDPRLEQFLSWAENKMSEETYEQGLARVTANPANADVNTDLIHPFVAVAEGDFDKAVELYRQYNQMWTQQYGGTPPAPVAPAVLGSDTNSAMPPSTPVEPKKEGLHESIDNWVREQRSSAAPPVGAV